MTVNQLIKSLKKYPDLAVEQGGCEIKAVRLSRRGNMNVLRLIRKDEKRNQEGSPYEVS